MFIDISNELPRKRKKVSLVDGARLDDFSWSSFDFNQYRHVARPLRNPGWPCHIATVRVSSRKPLFKFANYLMIGQSRTRPLQFSTASRFPITSAKFSCRQPGCHRTCHENWTPNQVQSVAYYEFKPLTKQTDFRENVLFILLSYCIRVYITALKKKYFFVDKILIFLFYNKEWNI